MVGYPYGLGVNPFSHVPTPTLTAAKVLGGRSWKEAREMILLCVGELKETIRREGQGFSMVSLVGPVGTGKTHLALHAKTRADGFVCAYVDLTRVEPKDLPRIYLSMLENLGGGFLRNLREGLILWLAERAEHGDKPARSALNIGFLDRILGRRPWKIALAVISKQRRINLHALREGPPELGEGAVPEAVMNLLSENFEWFLGVEGPGDALKKLGALAGLLWVTGRVLVVELDEITPVQSVMEGLTALINDRPTNVVLITLLRPEVDAEIGRSDPSLADRLRKAPFTYSLSHPQDPDEVWDIIGEYLSFHGAVMGEEDRRMLGGVLRYVWSEVGFSEIREVLAVMKEAFELARGHQGLSEEHVVRAVTRVRPTSALRGSVMGIPISEYFRILQAYVKSPEEMASNLTRAIRDLGRYLLMQGAVSYAHPGSKRIDTPSGSKSFRLADVYLEDRGGRKVVVSVKMTDKGSLARHELEDVLEVVEHGGIDRAIVLTNAAHSRDLEHPKLVFAGLRDKRSLADYLYFSDKFQACRLSRGDEENAVRLAKCIELTV